MAEAHGAVQDAYKFTTKLIPKLSTKGMGVLVEALVVGVLTIQDPALLGILQEAWVNQRVREEVKVSGEVSLIDRRKDSRRTRCSPTGTTGFSKMIVSTDLLGRLQQQWLSA